MSKRNKRDYFNSVTEDAIIAYNNTDDYIQKSIIYEKYIHYSFFKLTQNIIHTFKFYNTDVDDLEHLQHELIVFLLSKIHMYDHKKSIQDRLNKIINKTFLEEYDGDFISYIGDNDKVTQQEINYFIENLSVSSECMEELQKLTPPKAYSYFGTMVKRWLILYNKKNYDNKLNFDDVDEVNEEEYSSQCYEIEEDGECKQEQSDLSIFMDEYVEFMNANIYKIFPRDNDAHIADALLELFRKRDSIDLSNKKALYIYLREMLPIPVEEKEFDIKHENDNKKYKNLIEKNYIIEKNIVSENIFYIKYYSPTTTSQISKVITKLQRIFKHNYNFYLENDYISFKY